MHGAFVLAAPVSPYDAGLRHLAALSARVAFAMTCFALSWGVLIKTGWFRNLTGRKASTSSHMVFATLALAFGCVHAAAFLFLAGGPLSLVRLTVPFVAGGLARHAFGILGTELMLAIALSAAVRRFVPLRRWLWLHRLAYVALVLIVVHSVLGAVANGHLGTVWLGGAALLLPTLAAVVLRFTPARWLGKQAEHRPPPWSELSVSVDSRRCHVYGVCQREAATVFQITGSQLHYTVHPEPVHNDDVRMAARCCPMQAITVEARR